MSANRIAPDGTPHFAASHLRLFCLPMSHKKEARLIWVNRQQNVNTKKTEFAIFGYFKNPLTKLSKLVSVIVKMHVTEVNLLHNNTVQSRFYSPARSPLAEREL